MEPVKRPYPTAYGYTLATPRALALMLLMLTLTLGAWGQAVGDYRTRLTGTTNWDVLTTWERLNSTGPEVWAIPTAGQGWPGQLTGTGTVTIGNNRTVTLNVSPPNPIGALTITGGANTSALTFPGTQALTVAGAISIGASTDNDNTKNITLNAGTLTCGSLTIANSSGGNATRDAFVELTTGTLNVTGGISMGTTAARSYIRFNGGGTVNVGGTITGGNITSAPGGGTDAPTTGTVNYNNAGAQTVGVYTYHNLTLSGGGLKTITGGTVNGTLTMEGTATASAAPTYGAAATLRYNTATARTAGAEWITPFEGTGGVVIANTGAITMDGAKTFGVNAPLNINTGATLITNNLDLTLGGNFTNSGTFTAGNSNITIANIMAGQSIAGFTTTGTVSMTKTGGTTATLTGAVNAGNLTINTGAGVGILNLGVGLTHTVTGTWTRTAGTLDGGSSTLRLSAATPVSGTGGTFTAATGTVEYNAAGAQTVAGLTYNNLTLSGGGLKTTTGATVNGTLSMEGTATAFAAPTYGASARLRYNTATSRTAGVEWITPFTGLGGVEIANTGAITMDGAKVFNLSVPLTINSGATLSTSASNHQLTLQGNFVNNGTFTAGSSNIIISNTATQSIGSISTTGTVSMTKTGGTATLTGNVDAANLTINGVGGTLNLGAGLTHTVSGTWTRTAGTLNGGSSTLRLSAAAPVVVTGGTFTPATGTVEYNAAGAQIVGGLTYNNLTLSGGGTKTLAGAITVGNNLTVANGVTLATQEFGITGNATGTLSVGDGATLRLGLPGNAANVHPTLFTAANTSLHANSTVIYQAGGAQSVIAATYGHLIIDGGSAKTILGPIRVNNSLTLANGNLSTGSGANNITLATGIPFTATGGFSNTRMIVCEGTGSLVVEGTTPAHFQRVYPVGTGTAYTPMEITSFTGTVAGTGSISVRTAGDRASGTNPTDLNRHWVTSTNNLSGIAASATFHYLQTDVLGDETDYEAKFLVGALWMDPPNPSLDQANNNFSTTGASNLTGTWTARERITTLYSYQSGPWNNANTWTTDPSGTLSVDRAVPGALDRVVILNGRTVTNPVGNTITVASLQLNEGGTLDLGGTTGHNFTHGSGQGLLRLASATFPLGNFDLFVAANGGTVEYFNTALTETQLNQFTYNNLIINVDPARVVFTLSDMVVNGNLLIRRGIFRISDNTTVAPTRADLRIDLLGDVTVESAGQFTLGTRRTNTTHLPPSFDNISRGSSRPFGSAEDYPEEGTEPGAWVPRYYDIYHKVRIAGSLTNHGTVRFVSPLVTLPNFGALTGESAATVIFTGLRDATITANGITDFYNLILDKGTDQSYVLTVNASQNNHFRLFGRNNMGGESPDDGNPGIRRALWIRSGTLRLTGRTTIASLSEGACSFQDGGPNSDFFIPERAALIIDGPEVVVLSTADTFQEINHAWGFSAGSNVFGVDLDGCSSFSIRGRMVLNDGYFSTRESGGIIFWPGANGTLEVHGGFLDAPQVRSADGTDALTTFVMTGGNIQLRGQYPNDVSTVSSWATLRTVAINWAGPRSGASLQGTRGTFNIAQASNVFEMHGGTITVNDICSGSDGFAIEINAAPGNINVTGGTFVVNTNTSTRHDVRTNGPLGNLTLSRRGGTGTVQLASSLVVLNDLDLQSSTTFSANNLNVTVGRNFTINTGTTYTPGTNTTIFNGTGPQSFTNSGTITTGLNSMALANAADVTIAADLALGANLTLGSGTTLRDNGRLITVAGNISNSGVHFKPVTGAGSIRLIGTTAQNIGGDGNGVFNNLTVNKTGGSVATTAHTTVNGELRLATAHRLEIRSNMLTLGPEAVVYSALTGIDQTAFSDTRMILTNGLASDGGVRKTFSTTDEVLLPVGFPDGAAFRYMPATLRFGSAPTTWGSVAVSPVARRHHLAQGAANALTAYWQLRSTGFVGIPAGSVELRFQYVQAQVQGTESDYRPAVYRNGTTWTMIDDVNLVDDLNNRITFPAQSAPQGDYTAGLATAFVGIPVRYSSTSGNWNDINTWSATGVGGTGGASIPGPNTIVVIGNGTINHTVTIPINAQVAGALFIATGSTLDLGITTGHNFSSLPEEAVAGGGTLRIASSTFPAGDFGDFIGPNGGTVEYYTSGTDITIPIASASVPALALGQYRNLILNHSGGNFVMLPNTDLTIHGNLTVVGSGTGQARTNTTAARTVTVHGNLNVSSGTLQFQNGVISTIRALGDVNVASGASFTVHNAGGAVVNQLELFGNLNNAGNFNMVGSATHRANALFRGTANTAISGAGATYNFSRITVDKGSDPTWAVNLTSNISTTGGATPFLVLTNGIFRVDNPALDVTFSTSDFNIPSTAALSVINGTARVAHGGGNLILAGRLEVLGGRFFVGNPDLTALGTSIEYAAAGRPEIVVHGGELSVNGQIRRGLATTSGALNYIQSGGVVTILGRARAASRALLEIANPNSLFHISGGTLRFDRPSAAGTTFGDIHIRPHANVVEGGTLQVGLPGSAAGHTFRLSSSAPLWDVSVGNGTNQVLRNEVLPLTILNNLSINGSSQFNANGLGLALGGNLTNSNPSASSGIGSGGFLAGSGTQTVTLNGSGAQQIAGFGTNLTNFANLTMASMGTVTLQSNTALMVNGNLTLESGTLNDGEQTISVLGGITNTATHTSPSHAGGITLVGTLNQNIWGDGGVFGNLVMNTAAGATLRENTTINGRITFTQGVLYIDDYRLTLGLNATIGGSPDRTRMIMLNGALSDLGVRKHFPAGPSASFTFPIGVSGKYTPATYHIQSSGAPGSILVRPVNRRHPAVVRPLDNNALLYYWSVDSTGFGAPFSVSHTYQYMPEDVRPGLGDDVGYAVGHYRTRDYKWSNLGDAGTPGMVNQAGRTITISNANFVYGDVTAGVGLNFTPPFDIFYSRVANGNWTDPASWSLDSHTGTPASYAPFGNPVRIGVGHTIHLNANAQYSVSVEVNGTLDCGTTVFHNLGTVFGTGKIDVTSTPEGFFVLPGGNFDEFFDTPGTTVELKGSNTASMPLKPGNNFKPFNNLILSGTGQKLMSSDHLMITNNLTIRNGTSLSNIHNKNIFIQGNWINENAAVGSFIPGTGTVFFQGGVGQELRVASTENFNNLTINKTAGGVQIAGAAGIEVANRLTLTRGHIFSHAGREVTLTNTHPTNAVSGGGAQSFVDGPLRKNIINGQGFSFPVGNAGRFGRIELLNANAASSPALWTARYVNANPHTSGFPTNPVNLASPLTVVSNNEHWVVTRPVGGTPSANIRLRWDATSMPTYTGSASLRPMLRVVQWAPSLWTQRGEAVSGTPTAGTVATTTPVSANDFVFTIGAIGITAAFANLAPITICDNGQLASVAVNLTGTAPWTLSYRTTGAGGVIRNFTQTGITSSPFTIQLTGADMGGSAAGPFTLSLVSVTASGVGGVVNPATVPITVNLSHQPSIVGPTIVGTGQTRSFSTTANPSSTYLWEWVGTSGGGISTAAAATTNVLFNAGTGTYTLRVTETSSTLCVATHEVVINVQNVPAPDITPKGANLCQNTTQVYSTAAITGNEYRWSVVGGTFSPANANTWRRYDAGGNTIEVTWGILGAGSVSVEERVIATPALTATVTENFIVHPLIPAFTVTTPTPICAGGSTNIVVTNSMLGVSYQLRLHPSNVPVGGPVAGTGGSISLPTGVISTTTTYNVRAYNLGCELVSASVTATVNPIPTVSVAVVGGFETVCDADLTRIRVTYTVGTPTFTLTIHNGRGGNVSLNETVVTGSPYTYSTNPIWEVSASPSTVYSYTATIVDAIGCTSLVSAPAAVVTVWKIPETGPQFHIPNTHGF